MTKSISGFLLVVGLLWGLIDVGLFALAGGFFGNAPPSDLMVVGKGLLFVWWMWIGPLLMASGSIFLLNGTRSRVGVLCVLAGCVALTITMAYQLVLLWRDVTDPLVAKSATLYTFWAVAVITTVLADVGAVQIYRHYVVRSTPGINEPLR